MRYYVIPNLKDINKYLDLSKKYNLGFEFNEFFLPNILDNDNELSNIINNYKKLNRKNDTLHGVFFDIVLDSQDEKIRNISFERVESSIIIAKKLNCKGVVFHTNYITWMKDEPYRKRWVKLNGDAYLNLINKYDDIEIYIENMFDLDPYLLKELMEYINNDRIGVCLDVAHASISNIDISIWFNELSKYIKHIHINDNDRKVDLHQELGKGIIDYKTVYKYIKELKNKPSVLIEINDYEKVINSINYIKAGELDDFE